MNGHKMGEEGRKWGRKKGGGGGRESIRFFSQQRAKLPSQEDFDINQRLQNSERLAPMQRNRDNFSLYQDLIIANLASFDFDK